MRAVRKSKKILLILSDIFTHLILLILSVFLVQYALLL